MNKLSIKDINQYVEKNIGIFHEKRIASVNKLKLKDVLKRKNPYLYKAKHVLTAEQLVKGLVDAHISSSEEGIFGDWLEGLAIFVNKRVYGGMKSSSPGIDIEFNKELTRYIVNIKSGPNWGNSSQVKKMAADFNAAKKILRTSNSRINVVAVNGCCYGRDNNAYKLAGYYKYCGQAFWEFISGDKNLYLTIIKPLGNKAKERSDEFLESYSKVINLLTIDIAKDFCKDGVIDWEAIVRFNSSAQSK